MKPLSSIFIVTFFLLGGCQMQRQEYVEEGTISVNSANLYYKIMGEGEPIVVLHGGPGFDHVHMFPISELANDYKVIFYDQRATGNSTGSVDANSITVDNFVEDLEGLRKELNLEKMVVLGHSWGAGLAMFYSIKYPDNLNKLILLGCGGASTEYFGQYFENLQRNTSSEDRLALKQIEQSEAFKNKEIEAFEQYHRIGAKALFHDKSLADRLNLTFSKNTPRNQAGVAKFLIEDLGDFDIYGELSVIKCPTLIVHGDSDPFPAEAPYKLHKHIPQSKLVFLRNTGHFILHESPDQLFPIIRDFLKDDKSVTTSIPVEIEEKLKTND
jgi:proline iminopeptidase